jgi:hypothetical protein
VSVRLAAIGLVLASMSMSACANVTAEVTPIGPAFPARGAGCPLTVSPAQPPPYPIVDIASARVKCKDRRTSCIEELEARACDAGADAVYGFSETVRGHTTFITATFAHSARPPR